MPKFNEAVFGTKGKAKQLKTVDAMQEELLKLIKEGLTSGEGPLSDLFGGFNQEEFEKGVSQPALKNFQENILPDIMHKFAGQNNLQSSAYQKAKAKAGGDLQSQLAQLMYQAQQGQKQNRLTGLQAALGKQTVENIYKPGTEGALQGFIKGAGQGVGNAVGGSIAG
jgi:hypothetical protein